MLSELNKSSSNLSPEQYLFRFFLAVITSNHHNKKNSRCLFKSLTLCICIMKILYMKLRIRESFGMKLVTSCLPVSFQCFLSIPPEIIRKRWGFLMSSGGIKKEYLVKIKASGFCRYIVSSITPNNLKV